MTGEFPKAVRVLIDTPICHTMSGVSPQEHPDNSQKLPPRDSHDFQLDNIKQIAEREQGGIPPAG
jgi:hypothetical protein